MATRYKPSFEDRVAEYVDSPEMTHRIRCGKELSARIQGNYGSYRTQVRLTKSKKVTGDCSCPSEIVPCKHIYALRETWDANPDSFFAVDDWLKGLAQQSKAELVEAIERIVKEYPETLGVLGVEGFEEVEEEDEWYD